MPSFLKLADSQDLILGRFLLFSVLIHLVSIFVNWDGSFLNKRSIHDDFIVIEASLMEELPDHALPFKESKDAQVKTSTTTDLKKTQQQTVDPPHEMALPKKTKDVAIGAVDAEGVKKAEVAKDAVVVDNSAQKVYKEELFERLMREQTKQETQKKRVNEKKRKDAASRKKKIEDLLESSQVSHSPVRSSGRGAKEAAAYIVALKGLIKQNYQIPEVYRNQFTQVVEIHLDIHSTGKIQRTNLALSSGLSAVDEIILAGIENVGQFPKPPADLTGKTIVIRFQP